MSNINNPLTKDELKKVMQKIMLIEKFSSLDANSKTKQIITKMKKVVEEAVEE